jgi:hypothetical protein
MRGGNVLKIFLKLVLGCVLFVAAQACAPAQPTPNLNAINTAVAQTLAATTRTSEPGIPVTGDESPTPTVTDSVPTQSATAIVLPSPVITSTPAFTPAMAQVSVSVPTNCRVGPGVAYERVGALLVGEIAEVVGRHSARNYWIIRNPDRPGELCWLWGAYATPTGNTGVLPEFTPPPSPTPSPTPTASPGFDASYNGLESCTGTGWWVDIELENPGGITFNSIALTVRDTVTNIVLSLYADDFTDRDGCNESDSRDNLPAGEELLVSSPIFPADPSGHELRVTITLCSNPGQSGMCVTESFDFTP